MKNLFIFSEGTPTVPSLSFNRSLFKTVLLTVAAIVFTAVSAYLVLNAPNFGRRSTVALIAGCAGLALGLVGSFGFPLMYLKNKAAIILTNDGFYDYSSLLKTGNNLLPWEEVVSISPGRNGEIDVNFTHPDIAHRHLNPLQKAAASMNKTHLVMATRGIEGMSNRQDRIIAEMERYRAHRLQQHTTHSDR